MFRIFTFHTGCRRVGWVVWLLVFSSFGLADAGKLRDPMRPANLNRAQTQLNVEQNTKEEKIVALHLQSVLLSPGRKVAIINGFPLQIGARIDGAVLVRLEKNLAVLKRGSKEIVLKLPATSMKKRVALSESGKGVPK